MPGFIWSKYPKKIHMVNKFVFSGYLYLGPSSRLEIRLDETDQPKD